MHQHSKRLFEFGVYRLDAGERLLLRGSDLVPLTPKAFELLLALVERHGHLVEKDQLMQLVWAGSFVEETNLSHHISVLRSALGQNTNAEPFIETVPKRGYRFVAPVREAHENLQQQAGAQNHEDPECQPASHLRHEQPALVAAERSPGLEAPQPKTSRRRWLAWAVIAICCLAGGSVALRRYVSRSDTPQALRHRRVTFNSGISTFPTISFDGKLIAFSSDQGGDENMDIWLQTLNGQTTRLTSNRARDITPCFSPDGTQIAFRSDREGGGIFVVPVFGGAEQRLTANGWQPRFSPDGKFISYVGPGERSGSDFFIVPAGGGQPQRLAGGPIQISGGHLWTPDGLNLIFDGHESSPIGSNPPDWWILPISGGQPRRMGLPQLLADQKVNYRAIGPPGGWRGSHIVSWLGTGGSTDLWEFETSSAWALTGRATQLTSGAAIEREPRVSGNGRIVYYSDSMNTHLWKLPVNADATVTGPIEQLTSDLSLTSADPSSPPRVSINSNVLVFASARNGNMDIWTKDLRTGREAALTANPWAEDQPVVSPNGRWVAYRSVEWPKRSVRILNMSTRESRELCVDCGDAQGWSYDSKSVVIVNNNSVWLIDAFGGQRSEVVRLAGTIKQAALSPSGRLLAYVNGAVRVVKLAGTKGSMDADGGFSVDGKWFESLHWSASGDRLYFFSKKDDFMCLWTQRVDPLSGRTIGPARSVHHFHASRKLAVTRWIAVGTDALVVRLTDYSTSVWLASLE